LCRPAARPGPQQQGDAPPPARALLVLDGEKVYAHTNRQQPQQVYDQAGAGLDDIDDLRAELELAKGLNVQPGFRRLRRAVGDGFKWSAGGQKNQKEQAVKGAVQ